MDIPVEIQQSLGPKETIDLFVDEEKHPKATVDSVAITSERIIIRRSHPDVSKNVLTVYSYPDITGVGLEKGFLRSIIRLRVKNGANSVESIRVPSELAEQILGLIKDKVCRFPSSS
ncbi:MAG: PH domain-containing protein [Methanomassiliicoccales archaeon]|jgi:hypothetical protein